MAASCFVCKKSSVVGNTRSHSNIKTKRRWKPNLQNFKTSVHGKVMTVRVCAKCIKAGKLQKVQ